MKMGYVKLIVFPFTSSELVRYVVKVIAFLHTIIYEIMSPNHDIMC